MSDLRRFDHRAWDRLFELLHPHVSELTDEQIQAELEKAKIDTRPALARVLQAIEAQKARARFAEARLARPSVIIKIKEVLARRQSHAERVAEVRRLLNDAPYKAYAYKLESASSDKDLESILEDLERLDAYDDVQQHAPEA